MWQICPLLQQIQLFQLQLLHQRKQAIQEIPFIMNITFFINFITIFTLLSGFPCTLRVSCCDRPFFVFTTYISLFVFSTWEDFLSKNSLSNLLLNRDYLHPLFSNSQNLFCHWIVASLFSLSPSLTIPIWSSVILSIHTAPRMKNIRLSRDQTYHDKIIKKHTLKWINLIEHTFKKNQQSKNQDIKNFSSLAIKQFMYTVAHVAVLMINNI